MPSILDGVEVDFSRDSLFDELGILRLKESYMKDEEVSPQERFAFVSKSFSTNKEHAQRLYNYSSNHWLSFSTPILSFGRSKRGLPISCFLPYLHDSAESLVDCLSEVNWLSMLGGGIGIGIGIRSADDKSVGVMPHLRTYDASSLAYRQGRTRRGSYAAYLDISHPDILIFLEIRKGTGDQNMRCLNLHHGINITDDFMHIIEKCMLDPDADDTWQLKDPHSGEVREKVSARDLWQRILEMRMHTGEPYLHFIDTSNEHMPQFQKDLGLKIRQSNLCLTGDTLVNVIIGDINKTIKLNEVISLFNAGEEIKVESKNLNTGIIEYKQVTQGAMIARNSQLILIEDDESGKSIRCTPEHKIYTKNRGYVMAKDLKEDDELDIL
jgi:ribonucleoside-diphosphate reductase alpha chain